MSTRDRAETSAGLLRWGAAVGGRQPLCFVSCDSLSHLNVELAWNIMCEHTVVERGSASLVASRSSHRSHASCVQGFCMPRFKNFWPCSSAILSPSASLKSPHFVFVTSPSASLFTSSLPRRRLYLGVLGKLRVILQENFLSSREHTGNCFGSHRPDNRQTIPPHAPAA